MISWQIETFNRNHGPRDHTSSEAVKQESRPECHLIREQDAFIGALMAGKRPDEQVEKTVAIWPSAQ